MDQDKNDQEIKELLEKNLELNKENHELLKKMERKARLSLIFNSIKWIVIIGSALGLYYYFGQLLGSTFRTYRDLLWGSESSATTSATQSELQKLEAGIGRILNSIRQ